MYDPINTGLLSFGTSGSLFHAPFLKAHKGFNFTSVVERSEKKAHLQFPEIKSFASVEEILNDPNVELIVVNTPNYAHFEYAMKALQAGKHVLVEKPFALSVKEARQLFREARKHKRLILPYQNRRYDSDFLSVKEVINSKRLGQLVEVHLRFDRYRYTIGPKVAKESPIAGSGLLWDLGPHLVDMAISLFGEPLAFTKTTGNFRPKTKVDDYATLHLKYPDQLQVFLTMSMLVGDVQPAFVINGTRGSYVKHRNNLQEEQLLKNINPLDDTYGFEEDGKEGLLTIIDQDGKPEKERIKSSPSSYLSLFDDLFQTIRKNKPYPIKEEEIIQQLTILE